MAMHAPVKGLPVLLAVVMAVLMVFVVASASVEATPVSPTSSPVGTWSYGVVKTVSVGPLPSATDPNWLYQGTATFGYTVTSWLNNTSNTTFELTILRTMGAAFSVEFCLKSCSSPADWVNLSYRAWESTTWISTSAFQAMGAANYSYYYGAHGPGPSHSTIIGPILGPLSVASHGTVAVDGAYTVGSSVNLGGVTYPAINLTVIGPFSVREGVIFVPNSTDLFGSSSFAATGNASGTTTVQQSNLDLRALGSGHFGLAASSWRLVTNS